MKPTDLDAEAAWETLKPAFSNELIADHVAVARPAGMMRFTVLQPQGRDRFVLPD